MVNLFFLSDTFYEINPEHQIYLYEMILLDFWGNKYQYLFLQPCLNIQIYPLLVNILEVILNYQV